MPEVSISGRSIGRFPRAAITEFVLLCLSALRRSRSLPFTIGEVSLRFVDDDEMRHLNTTFRKVTTTTDVLTFPADDESSPPALRQLGDIIISVEQARRQAAEARHSVPTEIRYLILHGLIHAYGYDHERDDGEMHALEQRIRPRVGLD